MSEPNPGHWELLISDASTRKPRVLMAHEYRRPPLGSFAGPPLLVCDDGGEYWVKSMMVKEGCTPLDRTDYTGGMITDQVIGTLAQTLAPDVVPPVRLIDITDLHAVEPRLQATCAGVPHGSNIASANCSDRLTFAHGGYTSLPINKARVSSLAVLYGLAWASDHQVIYRLDADPLVYSVDHGHFFPSGPCWSLVGLLGAPPGQIDPHVVTACNLTPEELVPALGRLNLLTVSEVADAVSAPPDEWFFPMSHRVAVAQYLWARRIAILQRVEST